MDPCVVDHDRPDKSDKYKYKYQPDVDLTFLVFWKLVKVFEDENAWKVFYLPRNLLEKTQVDLRAIVNIQRETLDCFCCRLRETPFFANFNAIVAYFANINAIEITRNIKQELDFCRGTSIKATAYT